MSKKALSASLKKLPPDIDEVREFAESLIDTIREPLIALDQDLRIVKANHSFYDFFKVKPEETIGQLIYDLGNKQWDIPKLRELLEIILPQKTAFDSYEVKHDFSTIGKRHMLLNARQIHRALGKERIILLAIEDITEGKGGEEEALRQSEEKFSKAFQTSPYAITITHAEDGRFVEVNDAFTAIAGFSREEALADSSIGLKLWVNEAERRRVVDDLRAGKSVNGHEYRFRTKSGKDITGLFSAQIIRLSRGTCILSSINDITERKQADADLRIKNQVFEDSVASQSIADRNGVITHVNPAFLRLWGYASREQAIGNSVGSFFADPDDAKPVLEALAAHDAWEGEFRARRVDGTTFISRGLATSLRNVRGELAGYQSTNLDVTNEREAEAALRDSESKYRELFENAEVGMYRSKLDGTAILAANHKLCEIFGCTEADLLGNPAVMRWADAGARNRMIAELRKIGFLKDYEIDIITKGDEVRTCSVSIKLYPDKGCLEGSAIDITERKQAEEALRESEQKFRDTIKHLDEGYYSCTAEGLLLEHNLAFNLILGFDPAGDMKGKKLPDFWQNPGDRKEYLDELMTKGFVRNYLINAKKSGGEKIAVLANAHLIKDEKDRLVKIVGTFTDFTERKRAEEEIMQLNEQLGQKASELEQVVFIASHDLRSPLVNVQGFSKELGYSIKEIEDLLKTEGIPDSNTSKLNEILASDIPETLHFIQSSIAKMDALLAGLLKISRIGRVELAMENLDMNSFIKEIAGTFEYQFTDKGIAFTFSDLPVCRGDKVQINQVFSNIIDNAIKYGDPKRPCKISISGKSEKDHAVFCIEDNGIGIAKEHIGKIFEIFHRLNPAATSGEGLGLAIVQRILLKHKGKVWVESELGKGCRFFIELPA